MLLLFTPRIAVIGISASVIRPYASGGVRCLQSCIAGSVNKRITAKSSARPFKCYAGKIVAILKSALPDAGNAGGYGYAGNVIGVTSGIGKSGLPNGGDFAGWGKGYAGKSGAIEKCAIPNAGNAVGYGYAGKSGATVKSRIIHIVGSFNGGNGVGYGYAGKVRETSKSSGGDFSSSRYNDGFQRCRRNRKTYIFESGLLSGCVRGIAHKRYGYAGKAGATGKSPLPNAGNA